MKDYIYVYDGNNNKIKMEVVTIFNIDKYDFNYIIYKELDYQKYYIAKYKGDSIVDLNNDLSEEEMKFANSVFKGVIKNGIRN